ncbi:MAG: hypothetical protein M1832_006288 [Thelocarpon impressellum]|nr:MAG: hypothetical protein M1832_006288 [Thelocarpon impressellum]
MDAGAAHGLHVRISSADPKTPRSQDPTTSASALQQHQKLPMRLAHLRLPPPTPYLHASALQARLAAHLLRSKAAPARFPSPPDPTLLTAQFHPTYTLGRRESLAALSEGQRAHLRAGGRAEVHEALRGGETTFHGPGQLVAYGVLDLRRHGLAARDYVRLLEQTVIGTLAGFGVGGVTDGDHPGVWVSEARKIAALGVHLRRNVASHGVAVNVSTDLAWFERIVACGLEGKETTSLAREGAADVGVDEVERALVAEFAGALRVEGVYSVREEDVPP